MIGLAIRDVNRIGRWTPTLPLSVLSVLLGFACARETSPPAVPDALQTAGLSAHAAVLWVGAHPDDEALVAGALLAQLSRSRRRIFVVSLTRGEGTGIRGHEADEAVAAARAREYCLACSVYGAVDCASETFPSLAHLEDSGNEFQESPDEVIETWKRLGPLDPVRSIQEWIQRVRPEWIITLDPDHGMYGHPEHRAAARLVVAAAKASRAEVRATVFAAENRFASLHTGQLDPGPITLRLPAEVPCSLLRSCWEMGAEALAVYASQSLPDFRSVSAKERFTNLRELLPAR